MGESNIVLLPEQRDVLQNLTELKLDGFKREIEEQYCDACLFKDMTFEQRLNRCLSAQIEYSSNNRFRRLLQNSKIKNKLYIRQFSANEKRGLTADTLLMLKDCDYLKKGINIIISGLTGTGKTALASAAAVEAMQKGYSALFFRMNELSTIIEAKDRVSLARFIDKLRRISLILIDYVNTLVIVKIYS